MISDSYSGTAAYVEIFSPSGGSQHSLDPFNLFTSSLKYIFQTEGNHLHGPQRFLNMFFSIIVHSLRILLHNQDLRS